MTQQTVSPIDIEHLQKIRISVSEFIHICASRFDKKGNIILDIAPQDWEGARKHFINTEIKTLDIDPKSNADYIADITQANHNIIPSDYFDFVLCTEVLEHTLNPFKAADEIYRILKPGGFVGITVPLNFRIHGPLPDCWRFTRYGLESVLSHFKNIEITEIESERFLFPIQYRVIAQK